MILLFKIKSQNHTFTYTKWIWKYVANISEQQGTEMANSEKKTQKYTHTHTRQIDAAHSTEMFYDDSTNMKKILLLFFFFLCGKKTSFA